MTCSTDLRRRALAFTAAALFAAGCGGIVPAPAPRVSAEERQAFGEATALLARDRAAGETSLEAFLASHPQSSLADDAALALGDSARARGDVDAAVRWYRTAAERGGDATDVARVRAAALELERGNRETARGIVERARLSRLSEDDRRTAYRVLADVEDDPVARLRWLSRLRATESDEDAVALIDVDVDEILARLPAKDLRRAADQIEPDVPAARILVAAADASLDENDVGRAEKLLERASELALTPRYAGRMHAVRARLRRRTEGLGTLDDLPSFEDVSRREMPATAGASGTLGVILPLSGKFAAIGEESLKGILLAAGVFAPGPNVRVVIRDSRGRPELAAQAVRDLARDDEVSAIVGPIFSGECEAAAAQAEAEGIPLLALTARAEVARDRENVFRLRTEPREEIDLLVGRAMQDGAQRFAILYPRDAYGYGLRRLFWQAVELRGGSITGVASYDPEKTDFADPIRQLVGYVLLTDEEKKRIKEREKMLRKARRLPPEEGALMREEALALTGPNEKTLPPIVDFDAIFIPESHENVVLIAPQLAFHEAVGARLLGPNGWYDPRLVEIGRDHVEGALFTAHFYPESSLPFVRDFADRFAATYGSVPDVLSAQAYDAANLVLVQLARGRATRPAVRDGVLATDGYPGVTGVLTMESDGNARKRPFLLGVERGKIVQIN